MSGIIFFNIFNAFTFNLSFIALHTFPENRSNKILFSKSINIDLFILQ